MERNLRNSGLTMTGMTVTRVFPGHYVFMETPATVSFGAFCVMNAKALEIAETANSGRIVV
ncbi:hypothetical protein BCU12_13225 [Vibrio sp. 10N.261.55.A7]|nr:hypothetical protein BCU12_13225 [Vibrio sp. 10N.261.55.A7]